MGFEAAGQRFNSPARSSAPASRANRVIEKLEVHSKLQSVIAAARLGLIEL